MKRVVCIILMICSLFSFAIADIDLSSMTPEDLTDLIGQASNALKLLEPVDDNDVLYDQNGIKISIRETEIDEANDCIVFNILFINDTDEYVRAFFQLPIVDGWHVSSGGQTSADAHAKSKQDYLTITKIKEESETESFSEISTIEITLYVEFNGNDNHKGHVEHVHYIMTLDNGEIKILSREYLD